MCGICGIVRFDGQALEPSCLVRASAALRHRGPDHTGVWFSDDRTVALGASRLKVLDPSTRADQPLHRSEGRYTLVYNAEVYNFRDLRCELIAAGESFVTAGDTEVVLAACARWGVEAFPRFNGMWALAFYDSKEQRGFLCRDRFGVKPLVYVADTRMLAFASEVRALTQLGDWDQTIDPDSVVEHLTFGYIADPATIYRNARRLPPGHYLTFDRRGASAPRRYYEFPAPPPLAEQECDEARRRVRAELGESVVRRKVSDVPIGAFLSGGLDSSIVVAHLSAAIGRPIKTFSVGFAGQARYDETSFARLVARRFGTEHHELVLTERDVIDAIPDLLDHLGEPFGDSSIIPTSLLSKFAREHVTVALSGDAGDELLGGYWRYLGHETLDTYQRIPWLLRKGLVEPTMALLGVSRSSPFGNRIRQFKKLLRANDADPLSRHLAWSRILAPENESLFTDQGPVAACVERAVWAAKRATDPFGSTDWLNRVLASDMQRQLPADMLQKVDLASMMHSLEVRTPFLDPSVVELALSMPGDFKVRRGMRKRVLIDAYRGYLPDAVLDRSKQGFEVPIGEFFRGPLRKMLGDLVTRDAIESIGGLSYPGVERVVNEHYSQQADHADLLWALFGLCWWKRGPKLELENG